MKAALLALAAFSGFPGGLTPSYSSPAATPVSWADSWIMLDPGRSGLRVSVEDDLAPEASASDEIASDLVEDADLMPTFVFSGCELTLAGSFTPDSWAREIWLGQAMELSLE
jgi:hypothetical protein